MRTISQRAWPSKVAIVLAAWLITSAVGLFVAREVSGSSSGSTGPAQPASALPDLGWNGDLYPLGPPGSDAAQKSTILGAESKAGFPVLLPSDRVASRANLTQVWVSTYGRQVALVFGDGRVDMTMSPAQYKNPLNQFSKFVAEKSLNRVASAIGQVSGQPALVVRPNTSALGRSNPAYVEFERNGIDINIWSNVYGTDVLLAIANSIG